MVPILVYEIDPNFSNGTVANLNNNAMAHHFVLINPPSGATELPMLSLLRAGSIPIKSRSLRGVLLLSPYAEEVLWRQESGRVVLPGLRIVGQGDPPQDPRLAVLASAAGWWVANLACESFGRLYPGQYLRLLYEDIASSPREALSALFEAVAPAKKK